MDLEGAQFITKAEAANTAVAGVLVTSPFWISFIRDVSVISGAVAGVCGAIVGLVTVYRLTQRRRDAAEQIID